MKDEFKLIDRLLAAARQEISDFDNILKVPPGDDACLLSRLNQPVITTDTQRDGIHFKRNWQTLVEIGQKAVTVTLSDLAASYAKPISLFINLGLPSNISEEKAEELYKGIGIGLQEYNCALGGGNISDSDSLSLDLFAIGEGNENIFPQRSMAMPGDILYCTGPLGLARAGLEALTKEDKQFEKLILSFKFPIARLDEAKILAIHKICCVMDISDGLKGDALHIGKSSKVTIELSIDKQNIHPDLNTFCKKYNIEPQDFAIAGGEDYELLFSCSPELFKKVAKDLPEAYPVGRCLPFSGEYMLTPPSTLSSFQHGKKTAP